MTATFASAWLSGDARARALLPAAFTDRLQRKEAAVRASSRRVPAGVLDVVRAQNAALPASAERDRHVELLGRAGTVCVVTGQQLGLFGGPLFTIAKAASAIVNARALAAETGHAVVPVFWLQSEDHDLAEIDHVHVGGGNGVRISLADDDDTRAAHAASRAPVGPRPLGVGVTKALDALAAELATHPHAAAHIALLSRCYRPEATFTTAFAALVATLFADAGLVLVDPRDPRLALHAAAIHRHALADAQSIAAALAERGAALHDAGFEPQVHVRPGAPLSFYAPDAVDGPRFRLDPAGADAFTLVGNGAVVTRAKLRAALEAEPARFTTSALLRPLLQDTWLPTAAYVGGPAEMAYFAQLAPLYDRFELPMPLAVPRARLRVIDDRARALLDKLALTADDAASPTDALVARVARTGDEPPAALEQRLLSHVVPALAALAPSLAALDPSLTKALARADEGVKDAVARLVAKIARANAQRDQVAVERVQRLQALLHPGGVPQERVQGLAYAAARIGTDAFVARVLAACPAWAGGEGAAALVEVQL